MRHARIVLSALVLGFMLLLLVVVPAFADYNIQVLDFTADATSFNEVYLSWVLDSSTSGAVAPLPSTWADYILVWVFCSVDGYPIVDFGGQNYPPVPTLVSPVCYLIYTAPVVTVIPGMWNGSPQIAGSFKQTSLNGQALSPGVTYYYTIAERVQVIDSSFSPPLETWLAPIYANDMATATGGKPTNINVPVPPEWFQTPVCTAYQQLPIWGGLEGLFNGYQIPLATGCVLMTLCGIIILTLGSWFVTRTSLIVLAVAFVGIIVASIAQLLPMWMLIFEVVLGGFLLYIWLRG